MDASKYIELKESLICGLSSVRRPNIGPKSTKGNEYFVIFDSTSQSTSRTYDSETAIRNVPPPICIDNRKRKLPLTNSIDTAILIARN